MMHGFGISFGLFWLVVPAVLIWIALPAVRKLIHRSSRRTIAGASSRSLPEESDEAGIYRLAKQRGGRITVSDVVVATGIPAARAEEKLHQMLDGIRVRMEVDDDGVVFYEFAELRMEKRN